MRNTNFPDYVNRSKVNVRTTTQRPEYTLQVCQNPREMAAETEPIALILQPMFEIPGRGAPQQFMDNTTYVLGGVKCGEVYKVFMK